MTKKRDGIQNDLTVQKAKELYQKYGIMEDYAGLEKMKGNVLKKKYDYAKADQRLYNEDASKLLLLLAADGPEFGMEDAAIAWIFNKFVQENWPSSEDRQQGEAFSNLSNHINKYMGEEIAGGKDLSPEKLQQMMDTERAAIDGEITGVLAGLNSCKNVTQDQCFISELHTTMFAKDMLEVSSRIAVEGDLDIKRYLVPSSKPKSH